MWVEHVTSGLQSGQEWTARRVDFYNEVAQVTTLKLIQVSWVSLTQFNSILKAKSQQCHQICTELLNTQSRWNQLLCHMENDDTNATNKNNLNR